MNLPFNWRASCNEQVTKHWPSFFRSFYRTSLFTKHKRLEDSNGNLAKSRISANVTSVLGGSAFFKNQRTYWNTKLWTGWILFCGYIPTNYILWRIKTRYNYWKEDLYFIHRETKTKQNKYFALKRQKGNFSVQLLWPRIVVWCLWGPECTRNCGVFGSK